MTHRHCIAALCLLFALAARAQDRTIHVVVPLLAGAATDVVTRQFVAAVSQRLGQPIVVENKAGGATMVAPSTSRAARPTG